jgi:hypothetical protein
MLKIRPTLMIPCALTMLAACHGSEKTASLGGMTITSDKAEGRTSLAASAGTIATVSGAAAQQIALPASVPHYPGAQVVSALETPHGKDHGRIIRMDTSQPGPEVMSFYRQAFTRHGGRIDSDLQLPGGGMLSGKAEGQRLSIMVGPQEGKTTIIISIDDGPR